MGPGRKKGDRGETITIPSSKSGEPGIVLTRVTTATGEIIYSSGTITGIEKFLKREPLPPAPKGDDKGD